MKLERTERGFAFIRFTDRYDAKCSIQESSLGTEAAIWFGVVDADPKIMARDARRHGVDTQGQTTGWVPFPIPDDVLLNTHMHLTQEQVAKLLPVLQRFVETGRVRLEEKEDYDNKRRQG